MKKNKTEERILNIQERLYPDSFAKLVMSLVTLFFTFYLLFFISGCASTTVHQLPPHPPKYVYKNEKLPEASTNSLWRDTASIYEDRKARRVNDLVTINVVENIAGSGSAETKTSRESSADFGMTDLFGMNLDFNIHKLPLINGMYKGANVFTPTVKGNASSSFDGKGDTSRAGKLLGIITAKVVEVMPNGTLVIESRKDLTINNEKQILVLRGMIRPDDVQPDNSIQSSYVADAEIFFVGNGVIQDKQKPGWLTRFFDQVWPF